MPAPRPTIPAPIQRRSIPESLRYIAERLQPSGEVWGIPVISFADIAGLRLSLEQFADELEQMGERL